MGSPFVIVVVNLQRLAQVGKSDADPFGIGGASGGDILTKKKGRGFDCGED